MREERIFSKLKLVLLFESEKSSGKFDRADP